MKIVDIRERSVPLHSAMRNASIDFSKMTASVCAIITDVVRDGKPVIGYGVGSNGRYAQGGILRERLIPRVLEAVPVDLLDGAGANFDPAKVMGAMMRNEKPGGHGDRAVAAAVNAARTPEDLGFARTRFAPFRITREALPMPRMGRGRTAFEAVEAKAWPVKTRQVAWDEMAAKEAALSRWPPAARELKDARRLTLACV